MDRRNFLKTLGIGAVATATTTLLKGEKIEEVQKKKSQLALPPETKGAFGISLENKEAGETGWVFCRMPERNTEYRRVRAESVVEKGDLVSFATCCVTTAMPIE